MNKTSSVGAADSNGFSSFINRRQLGLLGAGAFSAAALNGIKTAGAAADDEVVLAYSSIGPNRHPWQEVGGIIDYTLGYMFFDSLLAYDAQGKIVPSLAESFEIKSLERIRLRIRDGVKFHTGKVMTVEDVKYSLEQALDPAATFPAAFYKQWLDHVDIIDNRTVETVAKVPYRTAPELLAYLSLIFPAGTPSTNYTTPIGTGPFRFIEFVPNSRVVAERNDDYWGPKPRFRKITVRYIPDSATRTAALLAKEIDYAENVSLEDIDVIKRGGADVTHANTNRVVFISFNRTAPGPFQDKRVRQAVHYAVDKDGLREALYAGLAGKVESIFSSNLPFLNKNLTKYNYDPAKAKALLKDAGYPNGFSATFVAPSNRWQKDREVAQFLVSQFQEVGIKATLQLWDFQTYQTELRDDRDKKTGKYGFWLQNWGALFADPAVALGPVESGSIWNLAGFQSPRIAELLQQGRVTRDQQQLASIYGEVQDILWDQEAQWASLYVLPNISGLSKKMGPIKLAADEMQHWGSL